MSATVKYRYCYKPPATNAAKKFIEISESATWNTDDKEMTWLLNDIQPGAANGERIGQQVQSYKLEIYNKLYYNRNKTVRVLIYYLKGPKPNTEALSGLLIEPTEPCSFYRQGSEDQYFIIMDELILLNKQFPNELKLIRPDSSTTEEFVTSAISLLQKDVPVIQITQVSGQDYYQSLTSSTVNNEMIQFSCAASTQTTTVSETTAVAAPEGVGTESTSGTNSTSVPANTYKSNQYTQNWTTNYNKEDVRTEIQIAKEKDANNEYDIKFASDNEFECYISHHNIEFYKQNLLSYYTTIDDGTTVTSTINTGGIYLSIIVTDDDPEENNNDFKNETKMQLFYNDK